MHRLFRTEETVEVCRARSLMTESGSGRHVDSFVFVLVKRKQGWSLKMQMPEIGLIVFAVVGRTEIEVVSVSLVVGKEPCLVDDRWQG